MQKIILLLPLVCLVFCAAQEFQTQNQELEIQSLIHVPNHNVDAIQRVSTDSSYLCPNNYVYLTRDFQLFNGVVCVETTITDTQLQQGDCSPGWATVSFNEVSANTGQYCNMIISAGGGLARIGFMASLNGNDCSLADWDISSITQTICVQREINDIKLVRSKDNTCGEGMVLVTQQEAQANQDAYCNLLEQTDIVRLADGGSMDGPAWSGGSGCKIRYEDRRDLSAVLCRAVLNSEPNETQNEPITETTTTTSEETTIDVEQPVMLMETVIPIDTESNDTGPITETFNGEQPILVPSQEALISNSQPNFNSGRVILP